VTRPLVGWRPKSDNRDVASVRIRCLNPIAALQAERFPVEIFDPARAAEYGVVVYSKLYDDDAREEAERLKSGGARVVVDLCDNHFHNPRGDPEWAAHCERLRKMLAAADAVV
jgi:hypothetical protein